MAKSKEEWAAYMREYRAKNRKKADSGDPEAKKRKEPESKAGGYRSAKSYIKNKATRKDISEFRDLMAERIKFLNSQNK